MVQMTVPVTGIGAVTLEISVVSVSTAPPPVTPEPPQRPIRMLWHFPTQWGGPRIDSIPGDVLSRITHLSVTMGQSAARGTGKITTPPDLTAAVQLKSLYPHLLVGATIGGSSDGGITVLTPQHVTELATSVARWPIDYLELDLEPSGGRWAAGTLLDACRAVGRPIVVTAGLYGPWTRAWGEFCASLGDQLMAFVAMCYDFPEAGDSRLNSVVVDKLSTMARYVPDGRRHVIGYMPRPHSAYVNASPPGIIRAAHAVATAKSPSSGAALWESKISAATGWRDLREML